MSPRCSRLFASRNKSLVVRVAPAHVHSPSSAGTPVQALVTKPPSSAKHVPRSRTSVRRVCWISSMVFRPKSVILRWLSRARLQRATSTASIMHRTWKTRYSLPSISSLQVQPSTRLRVDGRWYRFDDAIGRQDKLRRQGDAEGISSRKPLL